MKKIIMNEKNQISKIKKFIYFIRFIIYRTSLVICYLFSMIHGVNAFFCVNWMLWYDVMYPMLKTGYSKTFTFTFIFILCVCWILIFYVFCYTIFNWTRTIYRRVGVEYEFWCKYGRKPLPGKPGLVIYDPKNEFKIETEIKDNLKNEPKNKYQTGPKFKSK